MIILIVDDDAEDIELFCEAVSEIDGTISCVEAYNGVEALKILQRDQLLPHFIFLDINMPFMNGQKCLAELKRNPIYKDIPVVMYSTTNNEQQIEECQALGASFLTKPNSYTDLLISLRPILSGKSSRSHAREAQHSSER
jgi:CheY-like chemotaxis protein